MKRRNLLAAMVLLAAGASGCGKPWIVMSQAVPNPLLGQRNFSVMPIDFTGLRVGQKTEAGWLSGKDNDQRESWIADKRGMNDRFAGALMTSAADEGLRVGPPTEAAPFQVRPHVEWVEGGMYTFFVNRDSEMRMILRITDPDGQMIDEILVSRTVAATMTNPSTGGRLRDAAEGIGHIVADYLNERVMGETQ